MNIEDLISLAQVACNEEVASKKRALERVGELIASADPELSARTIFDSLIGRERLGSTGLGHGVALPHGRLGHGTRAVGAFIKLVHGIDFDAVDQQPVDMIFALLVPEHFTDEHLKILAYLAEMFSDPALCSALRSAETSERLYEQMVAWRPSVLT